MAKAKFFILLILGINPEAKADYSNRIEKTYFFPDLQIGVTKPKNRWL